MLTSRVWRAAFGVALLGVSSCAELAPVTEGVCGNGVVEPGEDCDQPAEVTENGTCGQKDEPGECRYVCKVDDDCPRKTDDDDKDDDRDDDRHHAALPPLSDAALANIQKIFAYGVRNSFGMTFDPKRGTLWNTENSGRAFDEINRVRRGANNGWIQFMGPLSRVADFKAVELSYGVNAANGSPAGLQQSRFPASRISDTADQARARLFDLPGSRPNDPAFSWKQVVPPAALAFVEKKSLGREYEGDLIVGSAVARAANQGHLYRFRLNHRRSGFDFTDPLLQDTVADNLAIDDFTTEGEEILFGLNFGIVTDIQTGPDGAMYLVGPAGTVRKIFRQ